MFDENDPHSESSETADRGRKRRRERVRIRIGSRPESRPSSSQPRPEGPRGLQVLERGSETGRRPAGDDPLEGPQDGKVRVRRRRQASRLEQGLASLQWELGRSQRVLLPWIGSLLGRRPLLTFGVAGAALWLSWPSLAPRLMDLGGTGAAATRMDVISVFVEDPERTAWALNMWKARPGSLLILQGRPSSQEANESKLRSQNLWPTVRTRMVKLEPGCDTVGQVDALARYLGTLPQRGRITLVTSPAHLDRSLAIAQIVIGPMGWKVEGMAAVTDDNRPESAARLWRDQVRAHVLRLTGMTGSEPDASCP